MTQALGKAEGIAPASGREELLSVQNIEVRYQGSILAVKNVSLSVAPGEVVALLGSNGAGKSTTLGAVSSLIDAEDGAVTGGSITYDGREVQNSDPVDLVQRGLVQVLEGRPVLRHMSVEQNIEVGAAARGASRGERERLIAEVYDMFPLLGDNRMRQAGYLSGGMQQMLLLGRALCCRPRLLLLDEPSLGLAPVIVKDIFREIRRVNEERGTAILLVEQNARMALAIADRGYVMENGRIVLEGAQHELLNNADLMEFYLGMSGDEGERRNYRETKHYKRRKRWLG